MNEDASLWALFTAAFLAATLLPGGSEAALYGVLQFQPDRYWPAIAVATLGNTLGGMSSYLIGRVIPPKRDLPGLPMARRYGSPVLLLSWVPFIGDPLCVAAGWLRLDPWLSVLFMAAGKLARYLVVAALAHDLGT
jgi:membrane protein YqaA with SNARE-associated domain